MNNKTVHRAFTVLLCLITVFVMIMAVTPLSFANMLSGSSTRTQLKTDSRRPYLTTYFYGTNSGMIDCRTSGGWYRFIIDNTKTTVNVINSSGQAYIWFNPNNDDTNILYRYYIGSSYGSFNSSGTWTTYRLSGTQEFQLSSSAPEIRYFNCGIENGFNGSQTISSTSNVYPNAYYPIMETATVNVDVIINNQQSIASSQEVEASSRQAEIMEDGSDLTVSTIDNWVGGQDGLAAKMTNLAATLSVNADRFSSNQAQVSAQLSNAGAIISNAFGKFPSVIVACMFCFLIILIAVKVVGR